MTLEQILQLITHDQRVKIRIVESDDEIYGKADVLNNYICTELANAEVAEINTEKDMVMIWVKE